MEPGASRPKPGGDPSAPMDDAEVEKTLSSLESITSTLVHEVGTPPDRAAEAEAQAAATASQVEDTSPPADADMQSQVAPGATDATNPDMPSQNAAAAPAETADTAQAAARDPQTESRTPAAAIDAAQPDLDEGGPSAAQTEPGVEPATPAAPEPALDEPKPSTAASADAEVEQEISQAIQQLQSGQPAATRATAAPAEATSAGPSIARRILRGLARTVDGILAPLSLLALLLDLPFRWMPIALKHLLGYVAIATALMAGAVWYYIIAVRPD